MSTLPNQADLSPSWKQEVNRRVAAHKTRKASSADYAAPSDAHHGASNRGAAAAARVAARYASAPSYSDLFSVEDRAAATAFEANAAADSTSAGLQSASTPEPAAKLHTPRAAVSEPQARLVDEPVLSEANPGGEATDSHSFERQEFEIRWEPDLPVRAAEPAVLRARRGTDLFEVGIEEWKEPAPPAQDAPGTPVIEVVEAAQPIHANLIEFPRELVATRKIRPRLAEGPFASAPAPGSQLSIFEVDPSAISIEPAEAGVVDEASAPVWTAPEWSGIELDEQPQRESVDESPRKPQEKPAAQAAAAPELELAPLSQRLMAAVVNGALVMGAILGAAVVAAANVKDLPPLREIELGSVVALVVAGLLYQMLFSTLASGTPGMKYARISLCTFDGLIPTRAQRCRRLGALLLSLLPVGLGVVWAIFDEDRLSWHDRLSGTYLRKD